MGSCFFEHADNNAAKMQNHRYGQYSKELRKDQIIPTNSSGQALLEQSLISILEQKSQSKSEKTKKNSLSTEIKGRAKNQQNHDKPSKRKQQKNRSLQKELKSLKSKYNGQKQQKQKQSRQNFSKNQSKSYQNKSENKKLNWQQKDHRQQQSLQMKLIKDNPKNKINANNHQYVMRLHQNKESIKEMVQKCNKGIYNIGNSCYLNSALQCLYQTKYLNQQLQNKKGSFSNNIDGQFTKYYNIMCFQLFHQKKPFNPTKIKSIIQKSNDMFIGSRQHDSGEAVNTILNIFEQETNKVKEVTIKMIEHSPQKTDQSLFRQYVRKHRAVSNSIIDLIFTGYFKTVYKCKCGSNKRLFEKFTIVYLPLMNRKNKLLSRLQQCISQFCQEQFLDWECSKCDKQTLHKKTMQIYKANKTIIFCLKRFNQDNTKIKTDLTIPLELNLNDSNIVTAVQHHQVSDSGRKHLLYAAIIHLGQFYSGHYIAYCFDCRAQCWALYNDSSVCFVGQNQVKGKIQKAYLLFYRLQTPEEQRRQKEKIFGKRFDK